MSIKCLMNYGLLVDYPCSPACALFGDCMTAFEAQGKARVRTNADRIRAMSDEELAEWLVSKTMYQESAFSSPSYLNFLTSMDDTKENAIKGTVKWLKQPAPGDARGI